MSLSTVDSALQYLESLGYVKLKRYKNGGFVQDITHQGVHYKEFEVAKTKLLKLIFLMLLLVDLPLSIPEM